MNRSAVRIARRALFAAILAGVALARAETPKLLNDAINKLIADDDHWAFTQTSRWFDKAGKPTGGYTVERYDPSQPYDQQWQLIEFSGHAPSPSELAGWKREKARLMKHHGEKTLGDVLDLEHATAWNTEGRIETFLVPIMKNAAKRFPADRLEVFMDVDTQMRALTAFSLRPKGPFHIAGVVRIDGGEVDGRLETVVPKYAPALVWARGNGTGHILGLFKIGKGAEFSYSDFRRVRPFNERFDVKIGDVKALNF